MPRRPADRDRPAIDADGSAAGGDRRGHIGARGVGRGAAGRSAGAGASPVRRVPAAPAFALTVAAYLAGSLALHHRLLPQLTTATAGWTSSDSYQFVWWIRWLPWSLAHGDDPLYTTYLHAPLGVNGMWNTPVPVLAALFAPVTLTAGPVAAYNVAMILGPVVSGLALALALGVWVERWWPRAAAGLLYGFSPFVDRAQLRRAPQPGLGRAAAGPAVAAARAARRTAPAAVADRRARRARVRRADRHLHADRRALRRRARRASR